MAEKTEIEVSSCVQEEPTTGLPVRGLDETDQCHPCKLMSKVKCASKYCDECEELLCEDCVTNHAKRKATASHKPMQMGEKKIISCSPCTDEGNIVQATTYCEECEEYLCNDCTLSHEKRKATKTHKPIAIKDLNDKLLKNDETIPLCDSCKDDYKETRSLNYCKECNEYLCDFCTNSHKNRNATKTHIPVPNSVFRVRVVYEDSEGPYSEESDKITTLDSPASRIVKFAVMKENGNPSPSIFALPITEIRQARNENAKTKKFEIGESPTHSMKSKTIMLVGATGTGKSTLVDGLVNYVLGVNWDDPFRFTVIDLEQEEKDREKNQALSQTEWITCYTLNPEKGSRLKYPLNIIDTPGFGDTRGLKRDQEIVEQIRTLFSEKGQKGVTFIDAVCFLIKAPDARLTAIQSYIFQSIMSLFGIDIEKNICSLITFADGIDPPVIAALKESRLPFGKSFTFNNSGLFARNSGISTSSLSPMFWEMGLKSFRAFFDYLGLMETKSLQLTKHVLNERFCLEATVRNLQPKLDAGLSKVNFMKQEIAIIEKNKSLIKDNKNFEYEVEEIQQKRKELPRGQNVTNCTNCHFTCHERCGYANDDEKANCCAMDSDGNCKVCPDKCYWKKHANTPYIFEYIPVKIKKRMQTCKRSTKRPQESCLHRNK